MEQQPEPKLPKNALWLDQDGEDDEEELGVGLLARHSSQPTQGVGTTLTSAAAAAAAATGGEFEHDPASAPTCGTTSEHANQEREEAATADYGRRNENEEEKVLKGEGDGIGNRVYCGKLQGTESISGISERQSEIPKIPSLQTNYQQVKNVEDQSIFGLSSAPVEQSEETYTSFMHLHNATKADVNAGFIGEIDEDLMELDVERVLKKQNTHDLYCPNCNSRITRRVILRKRKPNNGPEPEPEPEPEVPFSCSSCFSLFIPIEDNEIIEDIEAGLLEPTLFPGTEVAPTSQRTEVADAGEAHEWEILKSIVYGGLTESITSLGVVSSAAGAGADTLNVLALGMANLIGGLFVISHNLRELKNDQPSGASTEINIDEDRYPVLLGRRQNFVLHATLAILSFLIFGLVPPVVYGFSFLKSDNKDLKLAAVAGASLVCIILLALGKGHVRKPQRAYFRTVSHCVVLAITASGISFLAGELIRKLLEKLGLFESSSAGSLPFSETIPLEVGLASY